MLHAGRAGHSHARSGKLLSVCTIVCIGFAAATGAAGAALAAPVAGWQESDQLPTPLQNEVLVSDGTYLYSAGGVNSSGAQAGVYSTQVNADGSFAGWSAQPSLPLAIYNHAGALANGFFIISGGEQAEHTGVQSAVYTAPVSNGTIGSWTSTTPLPNRVFDHMSVSDGAGHVLVLGGFVPGAGPVATTYVATVNNDGTLGQWLATTPLPEPLGEASAAVAGGYVYVTGGHTTSYVAVSDVYSAPINSDGTLGAWTKLVSLPQARWDAADVIWNNDLFVVGGFGGKQAAQATVYRAALNGDGTIGPWLALTPMPHSMAELGGTLANGWMFAAGTKVGTIGGSTLVQYAAPQGPWFMLSKYQGIAGTKAKASGTDYPAGDQVKIYWDSTSTLLGTATADSGGSFGTPGSASPAVTATIPANTCGTGTHQVIAISQTTGAQISVPFKMTC